MSGKAVRIFRHGDGTANTAQTAGMDREEFVSTSGAWAGMVQTGPGFTSGWHHHGDYDTFVYVIAGSLRLEFGEAGQESAVAHAGEVAFIPRDTVHRESNPGAEPQVLFAVRAGQGAPVFNVEGP